MRKWSKSSDIVGYKLEIYSSEDFDEARDVAVWLHNRGYKCKKFAEPLIGDTYKTYARIVHHRGDEPKKLYFVEFLSPYRWSM